MLIYIQFILFLFPISSYSSEAFNDKTEWKSLLHIENEVSDVVSSEWFLSQTRNLDDELETLKKSSLEQRCEFPLRSLLIENSKSVIDLKRCIELNSFYKELDKKNISLLLASEFYRSPASTYGHISLVFHDESIPELNSEVVHYSAVQKINEGFFYSISGVTGGLYGNFFKEKFFKKFYEYSLVEQRKMFFWKLNLSEAQKKRLIYHLYELTKARFRYYFLSENCSYQIAKLLGVAFRTPVERRRIFLPSATVNLFKDHLGPVQTILPLRDKLIKNLNRLKDDQNLKFTRLVYNNEIDSTGVLDQELSCSVRIGSKLSFLEKKSAESNYKFIQENYFCREKNLYLTENEKVVRLDQINTRVGIVFGVNDNKESGLKVLIRPTAKDPDDFQTFNENSEFTILSTEASLARKVRIEKIDFFSLRQNTTHGNLFKNPSWLIKFALNRENRWLKLSPSFRYGIGDNYSELINSYYFIGPEIDYVNGHKFYTQIVLELGSNYEFYNYKLNTILKYKRYFKNDYFKFDVKLLRDFNKFNIFIGMTKDKKSEYTAGVNMYF